MTNPDTPRPLPDRSQDELRERLDRFMRRPTDPQRGSAFVGGGCCGKPTRVRDLLCLGCAEKFVESELARQRDQHQAELGAVVEECAKRAESFDVGDSEYFAKPVIVGKAIAARIRQLHPDANKALEREREKARLEEAKWWHIKLAMAVLSGDDPTLFRDESRERISELSKTLSEAEGE